MVPARDSYSARCSLDGYYDRPQDVSLKRETQEVEEVKGVHGVEPRRCGGPLALIVHRSIIPVDPLISREQKGDRQSDHLVHVCIET
jgi:hypothetical protein